MDLRFNDYIHAYRDWLKVAAKTVSKHAHQNQAINTEIFNVQYINGDTGLTFEEKRFSQNMLSGIDWVSIGEMFDIVPELYAIPVYNSKSCKFYVEKVHIFKIFSKDPSSLTLIKILGLNIPLTEKQSEK